MQPGALIGDLDVAQLLVVAFLLFFFGLVLHLRREDKREGFPTVDPIWGAAPEAGFPPIPAPKTYRLRQGGVVTAPGPRDEPPLPLAPAFPFPGASLEPTGDPVLDGVGAGAWALRRPEPLWFSPGVTQLAPFRVLEAGWSLAKHDPDPRGLPVTDAWGEAAGLVRDLWLDRGVKIVRYLEVETWDGGRVLLPIHHTEVRRLQGRVALRGRLRASRLVEAPRTAQPDVVTAREEDRICAFYAGARFFDDPQRRPPRLAPWERRARRAGARA